MSSKAQIKPGDLGDALGNILEDFLTDCERDIEKDVRAATKVAREKVKEEPAGAGKYHDWDEYSAGWRSKVESKHFGEIVGTVYQKSSKSGGKPGLTHLLEEGHINADGKTRARAFPHVQPAADAGAEELMRRLKNGE